MATFAPETSASPAPSRPFTAIAAMAQNRVIGAGGAIPWHLSGDFKFFKRTTLGHVLVMGRRTYESIGRPLPGRTTVVLSRSDRRGDLPPEVLVLPSLEALLTLIKQPSEATTAGAANAEILAKTATTAAVFQKIAANSRVFIAGGAMLYAQALPFCHDLYLTRVHAAPTGDAFFPPFEEEFDAGEEIEDCPEYTISHHRRL